MTDQPARPFRWSWVWSRVGYVVLGVAIVAFIAFSVLVYLTRNFH